MESALWWDVAWGMEVVQKETVDTVQYCQVREVVLISMQYSTKWGHGRSAHGFQFSKGKWFISTCNALQCNGY